VIDCPICHVKNNDDARFCAECGQRLASQGGPSLNEAIPAAQAPRQAAPPPAQAAPPPIPSEQQRPKLKSPLLSGDDDYGSGGAGGGSGAAQQYGGAGGDDAGVNRLRQMGGQQRQQPVDPATDPNRPFKNPYDPRNAMPPENQQPSGSQEGPRKLRSPLLSGEEFDDSDFAEQDPPPANIRGGGLRSPLLGGGEGGGGGSRSPKLGGGRQGSYDDADEEPHTGGGGLRSPLLGGGGDYGGTDRRRAEDAQYGGQERRRGLRSPILGGGGGEYYDDYEEDDEPIDEDNPNVLRSPLLAAKRPLSDRPRTGPMPAQSNTKNPPPVGQMPDIGRNLPNPSNSYTSLRSVRNAAPSSTPAPQAVPPVPTEPVPQQYQQQPYNMYQQQQGQQQQGQQQQGYQGHPQGLLPHQQPAPTPQQPAAGNQAPGVGSWGASTGSPSNPAQQAPPGQSPVGPPTNVPPSFSSVQPERRPPAEPPAVPTAQPIRPDEVARFNRATERSTEDSINVQAPISGTQAAISPGKLSMDEPTRGARRRPGLLSSGYGDDEEDNQQSYSAPSPYRRDELAQPSPLPKIIGALAMVLFLVKAFSFFTGFMASDWKNFSWLMLDQITMLGMYLCVAVLAFTRKD
jgi:hypothetical protein